MHQAPRTRSSARARCIPFFWTALFLLASVACATPRGITSTPTTATTEVTFVIPDGTEAALERGDAGAFQFPDEIHLQAGQAVVITNHDHAMHYFFEIPVAPGQTIRKSFARTGSFVYQGGASCSITRNSTIRVRVD